MRSSPPRVSFASSAARSERRLREYEGTPAQLMEHLPGIEILVVHGAPVTDEVLTSSGVLRLVCCEIGATAPGVRGNAGTAHGAPPRHRDSRRPRRTGDR